MRMTLSALLDAVQAKIAEAIPEAEHYRGRLKEGFSRPAFLYTPIYQGEKKTNFVTSKRDIEVQIIYFGKMDRYGQKDMKDRLRVQDMLDGFLNQFYLEAGERRLHFTYEIKETDGKLTYYLTFTFYDESFDQRMLADEAREAAESVEVTTKVTGA